MKGFTLIEMIAIVIILAMISLFAFPALNKMIMNAQIDNDKQVIRNVIDEATIVYNDYLANGTANSIIGIDIYNILDVKDKPEIGHVMINEYGNISVSIIINDRCYKKAYNDTNIELVNDATCNI